MTISINEAIDDEFEIPLKDFSPANKILIDLGNVHWIISEGMRKFRKWLVNIEKNLPNTKVQIERIRPIVARQLNLIKNLFGSNVVVSSIYVPFYCEDCDLDDVNTLVTRADIDSQPNEVQVRGKTVSCPKCGQPMGLDVIDNYFRILS